MKKKKRILISISILILAINSISAIGFGHHIFEMRTTPEFSLGVYPTSLKYQFNFPVPDMVANSRTEFALRLDNGIDFRTIKQDPLTGNFIDANIEVYEYPRSYMTFFDDFLFLFSQGFLNMPYTEKDLLTAYITAGGRFEKSYERLNYLSTPDELEGLFYITPGVERFDSSKPWIGTPELQGNRNTMQLNISLGFNIDYMQDKITRKNGIKNRLEVRLNPDAMQISGFKNQDFISITNDLDIAYTIFSIDQHGKRDTTWLSLVLENKTHYRCLLGTAIPYYAQDTSIWGAYSLNTSHFISNRTSLTLYGPQINSYDVYPLLQGFFDVGYSFGKAHNTDSYQEGISDLIMSTGMTLELNLFDIARFYLDYGYIIDNTLNKAPGSLMKMGFSIGI